MTSCVVSLTLPWRLWSRCVPTCNCSGSDVPLFVYPYIYIVVIESWCSLLPSATELCNILFLNRSTLWASWEPVLAQHVHVCHSLWRAAITSFVGKWSSKSQIRLVQKLKRYTSTLCWYWWNHMLAEIKGGWETIMEWPYGNSQVIGRAWEHTVRSGQAWIWI